VRPEDETYLGLLIFAAFCAVVSTAILVTSARGGVAESDSVRAISFATASLVAADFVARGEHAEPDR